MKSKKIALLVTSALAITGMVGTATVLTGCGGGNPSSSSSSEAPTITSVEAAARVSNLVKDDVQYGKTKIDVEVSGTGDFDESVTFASSNEAVLTVSETGVVTAVANGTAKVTVTSKMDTTKKAEVEINVIPPYVENIQFDVSSAYLVLGGDHATAEVNPWLIKYGQAASDALSISSEDAAVATGAFDEEEGVLTITGVGEGVTNIVVSADGGKVVRHFPVTVKPAGSALPFTGGVSYVDATAEERLAILGKLENYAMKHHITGISIMGNGGYVTYADGVVKGAETYVPGYGFGVLSDGDITKPLTGQSVQEKYNMYYHTYLTDDPATINYQNDKGSVVGDIVGYINGAYFGTFMNDTQDGYDWVKDLATVDRPIGLDSDNKPITDKTKKTTKYRIPLNLEVKYHTLSNNDKTKAFNNRKVELEDYLTPYKIYYTQAYGMARGSENLTGSGSIKGAEDYYKASAKGFDAEAFKKLGIHTYTDGDQSGLEFEFNTPCTPFYAMYYLSSSMFGPVPASFIEMLGGVTEGATAAEKEKAFAAGTKVWGCFTEDLTLSPVDTTLSTGAYTLESWVSDSEIVFKKNPNYETRDPDHYKITGVHYDILSALKSDTEAALKEFVAGNLSSTSIPSTKKDEWITKPGVYPTEGDSNFKVNVNTCDPETWEYLFGVNGTIAQTAKSDYWECEPALSNSDFVDAISFAIDRKEFAQTLGRTVGFEYFSNAYLSDPESGIAYNKTDAHKANLEEFNIDAETGGYSFEKAKASFDKAITALLAEGAYKDGDKIELEIAWQDASDEDTYHKLIKGYLEKAFNECDQAKAHNLTLECKFWVSAVWSDVYYAKMMVGQFDLGFGSVSGNTYDPLNFLEVLKSDNSSGFTLNWGLDTSVISGEIEHGGYVWSFDGLWKAADQGAYFENGVEAELVGFEDGDVVKNADGSYTITVSGLVEKKIDDDTWGKFSSLCIFATDDADYETYSEYYVSSTKKDGSANPNWVVDDATHTLTVTLTAEEVAAFKESHPAALIWGVDLYCTKSICGSVNSDLFFDTCFNDYNPLP